MKKKLTSTKKPKNKGGRPSKKDSINLDTLKLLCIKGFTDEEICSVLGICRKTLHDYKKDPKFLHTIKDSKKIANDKVISSLFERACGYEHPEEKVFCTKDGSIVTHQTTKRYAPETQAIRFWLMNRDKENWRDKSEVEFSIQDIQVELDAARKRAKKDNS